MVSDLIRDPVGVRGFARAAFGDSPVDLPVA